MVAASGVVERWLVPVDAVRRDLLARCGKWLRPFIIGREARVALVAVSVVATALASTLFFPLWVLALGPILFGVPHVLADVRYLVIRPGLHRRWPLLLLVGGPLLLTSINPASRAGLLAVAGALLAARASARRRAVGLVAWAAAFTWVAHAGRTADVIIAHLHNVVAVGLWWWWRPRSDRRAGWAIVGFVVGLVLLGSGFGEWCLLQVHGYVAPRSGLSFDKLARELAPLSDPTWVLRLMLSFAFAQAVHYGVWLRLIPEDDRPRATPRSFAASYRALREDFGTVPLVVCAGLAGELMIWAVTDLAAARAGYLRGALFHGYLEFAAIALFWVEGWRPVDRELRQPRPSDPDALAASPAYPSARSPAPRPAAG